MRVRVLWILVIALSTIASVGCPTHEAKPAASPATSESAPPPPPTPNLLGSQWLLEDLGGQPVIDQVEASLSFPEPGKAAGNGSCNQFSGTVKMSGVAITFGPLSATHKECVPNVNDQEAAYLKALQAAEWLEVDELFLSIHYKGGDKPLHFIRASLP